MEKKIGVVVLIVVALLVAQTLLVTGVDHTSADVKTSDLVTHTESSRTPMSVHSIMYNGTCILDPSNPPNFYGDFGGAQGLWGMYSNTAFVTITVNWTIVSNYSLPSVSVYIFTSSDNESAWIESGGTSKDYSAERSSIPSNGSFSYTYSPTSGIDWGVMFKNDGNTLVTVIYSVTIEQLPSKCHIVVDSTIEKSSLGARVSFVVTVWSGIDINYSAVVQVPSPPSVTTLSGKTIVGVGTVPSFYQPASMQQLVSWPNYLQWAVSFELTPHSGIGYPDFLSYDVDSSFSAYVVILLVTNEVLNSSEITHYVNTPQLTPDIQLVYCQDTSKPSIVQATGNGTYGALVEIPLNIGYETSSPLITPVLIVTMVSTAGGSFYLAKKRKPEWLIQSTSSLVTMWLALVSSPNNPFEWIFVVFVSFLFATSSFYCWWEQRKQARYSDDYYF